MTPRRTIFLCIILSALVAWGAVKLTVPENTRIAAQKESAFDRVMRTNTIRCGYYITKDFIIRDEKTGKLSGPAYDIMNAMARNLSLKVEWAAEIGLGTMAEDLKQGRYDMICVPLTANAPRGKVMFFSHAAFFLPVQLWVHKDNMHAQDKSLDWANSKDVTFSAIDGISFLTLTQRLFPQAKIYSLPEMSPVTDMLQAVASKKTDAVLITRVAGDYFAHQNDGVIQALDTSPVALLSMRFPLPRDDEKLRNMIDVALDELLVDGSIDRILSHYDTAPPKYFWHVNDAYRLPH